ncbi:MAG: transporter [Pseudomonadota bacterium]|nr:transporter [Pseudomonadota bacterium]
MNRTLCTSLLALSAVSIAHADSVPDSHAPIGVMGDHIHKQGEVMFSYRYAVMSMQDNLDGDRGIGAGEIVSTMPNRFAGMSGMPSMLRVVPTHMDMDMHMLGLMYAPNNRVTLMAMASQMNKRMRHTTYQGGIGTTRLGRFEARSKGWGDSKIKALIRLNDDQRHRWHATFGLSLPTGSLQEEDVVLAPNGAHPRLRLPYPMQLGSGTYDFLAGLTYSGGIAPWGWGAQWESTNRLGRNDEDYRLGNSHLLQGWVSRRVSRVQSLSLRLIARRTGNVDGRDLRIMAPVQTADPGRQRYRRTELWLGTNVVLAKGHRLALEIGRPLTQTVDGPQMDMDWQAMFGWQWSL